MWIVGDQAGGGEAVLSKLLDSECEINCEVWCSLKSGNDKKLKSAASANNLIHNQKWRIHWLNYENNLSFIRLMT